MLDFVVKLQVLVCRPAAPRRTSARPAHKHAQSRRSADGPRCRGGCRTPGKRARVRHRHGIGLVRRGRDRVRGGAASSVVFGASYPCGLARRWRQATYPCWMRADVVSRPFSARESTPWCCWLPFRGASAQLPRPQHQQRIPSGHYAPGRGSRILSRASERVQPCSLENSRQRTHGNSAKGAPPVSTPHTCGAKRLRARLDLKRGTGARTSDGSFCGVFGTSVLSKSTSSASARRCGLRRSARHA